jgi:hypothetical protein
VTIEVGVPAVVNGTTASDADEYVPLPALFAATTLNLYEVPFVSPVTVYDVDVDNVLIDEDQVE